MRSRLSITDLLARSPLLPHLLRPASLVALLIALGIGAATFASVLPSRADDGSYNPASSGNPQRDPAASQGLLLAPAHDPPDHLVSSPEDELQSFVAQGRLEEGAFDALRADGAVDVLVLMDDSAILTQGRLLQIMANADRDTLSVRSAKRLLYSAQTTRVVGAAPPSDVEILTTYNNFSVVFLAVKSEQALLALLQNPEIASISTPRQFEATLNKSLPLINQPPVQASGYTGAGTSVAVLDSGVDYRRPAFGSCTAPGGSCKVVHAADFAPDDGQLDDDDHGTNVAGIVVGVAPGTKIIALDVFDGDSAWDRDIFAALDWVIDNADTYNIVAVNLSLGDMVYNTSQCPGDPFAGPVNSLRSAGVLVVTSSGNHAYHKSFGTSTFKDGVGGPACVPGVLSVGQVYDSNLGRATWGDNECTDATTAADRVVCSSNTAPFLSLLAPGARITAAGITMGGTSQAAPHVSGAVAVLRSKNPDASLSDVESALTGSGPLITDRRVSPFRKTRRLDLQAAANAIGGPASPTPATSPSPTPTTSPSPTPTPTPTPSPTPTPTPTPANIFGDVDCDEEVDSGDAMKLAQDVAGLVPSQRQGCPAIGSEVASLFGDVDCDSEIDSGDAMKIAQWVAGLSVSQQQPCPPLGSPLAPTPTPTPTPSPTPTPMPTPTGQAFNFTWYLDKSEPGGLSDCNLAAPVPPNSPADTGLCVAFILEGFAEQRTIRLKLYLDTILMDDSSWTLLAGSGPWQASWPLATPPGEYFLEVFVDEVLVGTSTVEAPAAPATWPASDFQWYQYSAIVSPFSDCDLSKPVPPNSVTENGLCVEFYLEGFTGLYDVRFVLYRDGVLLSDFPQGVSLSVGYWQMAWPSATLPGTYSLEVFVDDVLVGTSTVEAP